MISRINKALDPVESVAMVVAMTAATIVTSLQVLLRYVFDSPLIWAGEFVIYSIICMSFIGASMGVRHGVHISVDVLHAILPQTFTRWIRILSAGVGVCFAIALGLLGFQVFWQMLQIGQASPAMRIPIAWVYLPIAVSAVFMILRYIGVIVEAWHEQPRSLAEQIAEEKDKLV